MRKVDYVVMVILCVSISVGISNIVFVVYKHSPTWPPPCPPSPVPFLPLPYPGCVMHVCVSPSWHAGVSFSFPNWTFFSHTTSFSPPHPSFLPPPPPPFFFFSSLPPSLLPFPLAPASLRCGFCDCSLLTSPPCVLILSKQSTTMDSNDYTCESLPPPSPLLFLPLLLLAFHLPLSLSHCAL